MDIALLYLKKLLEQSQAMLLLSHHQRSRLGFNQIPKALNLCRDAPGKAHGHNEPFRKSQQTFAPRKERSCNQSECSCFLKYTLTTFFGHIDYGQTPPRPSFSLKENTPLNFKLLFLGWLASAWADRL